MNGYPATLGGWVGWLALGVAIAAFIIFVAWLVGMGSLEVTWSGDDPRHAAEDSYVCRDRRCPEHVRTRVDHVTGTGDCFAGVVKLDRPPA